MTAGGLQRTMDIQQIWKKSLCDLELSQVDTSTIGNLEVDNTKAFCMKICSKQDIAGYVLGEKITKNDVGVVTEKRIINKCRGSAMKNKKKGLKKISYIQIYIWRWFMEIPLM